MCNNLPGDWLTHVSMEEDDEEEGGEEEELEIDQANDLLKSVFCSCHLQCQTASSFV